MSRFNPTNEQDKVLSFSGKNLIVSASAGSGKTATLVEFITRLIESGQSIKRVLLLTFTRAASFEMKERLLANLYSQSSNDIVLNAIDDIPTSDISTIHAFLEKVIKRNANILPIDEGFIVFNEEELSSLKQTAFEKTENSFKKDRKQEYEELYLRLHNNREFIFSLLERMSSFFATLTNPKERIEVYKKSQKEYFKIMLLELDNIFLPEIKDLKEKIDILKYKLDDEKYTLYIDNLQKTLTNENSLQLFKQIESSNIKSPTASKKVDPFSLEELKKQYKRFKQIKDELSSINIQDDRLYNEENFGKLEEIIYDFFIEYDRQFSYLKRKLNGVDFNDLESYAKEVLSNEEVRKQLQEDYDYIFIDEYQDTNFVQESIVKEIAKNGHFVAVGDPKQGIYGFRNATSEIIKKDIKEFKADKKSSAEFLRKNFRSDLNILNFVNKTFINVMKEDTVGIDYEKTSMLESGLKECVFDCNLPSVRIDIVKKDKAEEKNDFAEVYDILEDSDLKESSKNLEAKVIATRIQELLLKQIYDPKLNGLRYITYKDIVVLTRGKSELVGEIIKELSACKIPVVSEIRGSFKDYAEILVLISLFKIMLDFRDDKSIINVMLSKIGGFSVDELALLRFSSNEKEFYNVIKKSTEKKVVEFVNKIETLKFKFEMQGAFVMLENLFMECDYRAYLLSKSNAQNQIFVLDKFLDKIKTSGAEFDLPKLVKILEQEQIDFKGGGNSSNAVSICTIHSSKGLEYPVVILADTGKTMLQSNKDPFVLTEDYGLVLNYFSREEDNVYLTPFVYLLKNKEKERQKIDEIMLLYVALTRAQRHLYITGTISEKALDSIEDNPFEAKSFMEMILSSNKNLYIKNNKEELVEERVESNIITEVEDLGINDEKFIGEEKKDVVNSLQEYFDYVYPHKDSATTIFKNAVSSINEDGEAKGFMQKKVEGDFIERGNAYHLALKIIDFEQIENLIDLEEKIKEINDETINKYVDLEILFNDISILKRVLKNSERVFKERQFTSLVNLKGLNLSKVDEEIMIQGIVDLFALGEKNILVDYKFTNDINEKSIKKRYEKQLILYKNAIENAYNIEVSDVYLLSLKNGKLIKF